MPALIPLFVFLSLLPALHCLHALKSFLYAWAYLVSRSNQLFLTHTLQLIGPHDLIHVQGSEADLICVGMIAPMSSSSLEHMLVCILHGIGVNAGAAYTLK